MHTNRKKGEGLTELSCSTTTTDHAPTFSHQEGLTWRWLARETCAAQAFHFERCAPPLSTGHEPIIIYVWNETFLKRKCGSQKNINMASTYCKWTMQYIQIIYFVALFRKKRIKEKKLRWKNILGYKCFSLHMHMIILYYIRILMTCQEIYICICKI